MIVVSGFRSCMYEIDMRYDLKNNNEISLSEKDIK